MTSLDLTLTFPDAIAQRAEAEGLLTAEAVARLIERELHQRQQIQALFTAADRLAALDGAPSSAAKRSAAVKRA